MKAKFTTGATAVTDPTVKEYLNCVLPRGPCDNEADAAHTEDPAKKKTFDDAMQACNLLTDQLAKDNCFKNAEFGSSAAPFSPGNALKVFITCTKPCGRQLLNARQEDVAKADGIRDATEACRKGPAANLTTCLDGVKTTFTDRKSVV